MNQETHVRMYNDALIKAAIGVHIIHTVGDESGIDTELQHKNITTLIAELAEVAKVPIANVYADVMTTRANFPSDFFDYPEVQKLTTDLTIAMCHENMIGYQQ